MWTRQELKEKGKAAFKANYWPNVLVAFILGLLTAGMTATTTLNNGGDPAQDTGNAVSNINLTPGQAAAIGGLLVVFIIIAVLLDIFVWNPLKIGCFAFFKENVKHGDTPVGMVMSGFTNYGRNFLTMLLTAIYLALWTMLFIIPGIIKWYSYRMVPFIVRDHPELSPNEVITMSRAMMDGQKMYTFLLDLSFIGWFLLSALTLGLVGVFWTNPYYQNTNAALYLRLSGEDANQVPHRTV